MKITFTAEAWADYTSWSGDRKALTRINRLVNEAARASGTGTGKLERLAGDLSGFGSRRVDQEHRLVDTIDTDTLVIVQARDHYY